MNILTRYCFLVALLALLPEIIEIGDAYKLIRPYKYYQRRPWRRPRWYTGHKSSKFYHSKRIPPEDDYSHRPSYYRHGSRGDDSNEQRIDNRPYTIVIQLPKQDKYEDAYHAKRKRVSIPVYPNDSEYIDDEDDGEPKVVNVNDKRVQIKMVKGEDPKLHIKISRSDNEKGIEIEDKSNITALDVKQSTEN